MTETNDLLSPGDVPTRIPHSASLPGSALTKQALGNLLWQGAKDFYTGVVMPPGQILEGSLVPSMEPGPNMLSIPEYATGLALSGLGAGNLLGGAGEGAARQFGAWHGTRAPQFREFSTSTEHMEHGAGAQTEGHGVYIAGNRETSSWYHEPGVDLTYNGEPWSPDYTASDHDPMDWAMHELHQRSGDFDKTLNSLRSGQAYQTNPTLHGQFGDTINWLESNRDRIGVTPKGGLLRVYVHPEEEEFMDWDKPFSQQEKGVQEGILKSGLISKDTLNYMPLRDSYGNIYSYSNDPNGQQIYRQMVRDNWEKVTGSPLDHASFEFNGPEAAPVKQHVSETLDASGVVGNKYMQDPGPVIFGGHMNRPVLKHRELFETAPDPEMARQYLFGIGKDATVDDMLGGSLAQLHSHLKTLEGDSLPSLIREFGEADGRANFEASQANASKIRDLIDWTNKEHAAGNFKVGDNINRNYVVFNPKNVEIRTWDGRPLEPVDYDPFDVTRP